jgi:small subunit ribosomal protein S4
MGRYIGPVCRLCRREGEKLFLKGERCLGPKCAIERRGYAPGMHGKQGQFRRKTSDYGLQLRQKQKVRRTYFLLERQFKRYFKQAQKGKGMTGEVLLQILELRLDNVVHRLGFGSSRNQARQLVNHGHFEVNGRKTDIPSMLVKPGDVISVRATSRENSYFKDMGRDLERVRPPDWLSLDPRSMTGRVLAIPARDQLGLPVIKEQLVVEYYSR